MLFLLLLAGCSAVVIYLEANTRGLSPFGWAVAAFFSVLFCYGFWMSLVGAFLIMTDLYPLPRVLNVVITFVVMLLSLLPLSFLNKRIKRLGRSAEEAVESPVEMGEG